MTLKNEIRELVIEQFKTTSAHGLSKIFQTKNISLRIFWVVFWLTAFGNAIYFISVGTQDFYKYEVNTKSRIINERPANFPKVTICNLDPFVTSQSVRFLANIIREEPGRWDINEDDDDMTIVNNVIAYEIPSFKETALYKALKSEDRNLLGYSESELFEKCQFGPIKSRTNIEGSLIFIFKLNNPEQGCAGAGPLYRIKNFKFFHLYGSNFHI